MLIILRGHTKTCSISVWVQFSPNELEFISYKFPFLWKCYLIFMIEFQSEMLLIPNALCWSSRKCNCACALPAEVQLRLRGTRRSWQKLFAGKNFVKILVTAQTQLRSYSEQQRAFGNSNICNLKSLVITLTLVKRVHQGSYQRETV